MNDKNINRFIQILIIDYYINGKPHLQANEKGFCDMMKRGNGWKRLYLPVAH
jgi:hypothetical protein